MADDIEEFLKRVAEKRRGQQGNRAPAGQPKPQQQTPPQQRPPQQRQSPPPQQQPRQPFSSSPPPVIQRPRQEIPLADTVESSIHQIATNEVQQHAQQYMSRAEFEERSRQAGMHAKPLSHLESKVAQTRASREAEMQAPAREVDVFATPAAGQVSSTESAFTAMMKSREAFRSAFLLSLVLDKPAWKDD